MTESIRISSTLPGAEPGAALEFAGLDGPRRDHGDNSFGDQQVSNLVEPLSLSTSTARLLLDVHRGDLAAPHPEALPALHKTIEEAGEHITRASYSWSNALGTAAGPISFGFRTSAPGYTVAGRDVQGTFTPFTEAQKDAARLALQLWADAANITFVDLGDSNAATIEFGNYSSSTDASQAFAFYPAGKDAAPASWEGDVFINTFYASTVATGPGTYDFLTFVHEIGHALGLQHPGDYNATPGQAITYANNAEFIEDSRMYSVMSYFSESNTGGFFSVYPEAPMIDDIAAIQRLYGANGNTRTGSTTYGFGSNAGTPYDINSGSQHVAFAIWDGGGQDILDFSGYSQNQVINLNPGSFSSVGGDTNNVSIAAGVRIEDADGGSGNDTIIGNSQRNTLAGLDGDDSLDGQRGADALRGDAGDDTLIGGSGSDTLTGAGGDDSLRGDGGSDVLNGGSGDDVLDGRGGSDVLKGGSGNDVLKGNGSADIINGASGNDRLVGGSGDDVQNGGSGNDRLIGGEGDDLLAGQAGRDWMKGSDGDDVFDFNRVSESAPGSGHDRIADFTPGDDTIDLAGIDAIAGGGNDAFTFIGAAAFGSAGDLRAYKSGGHTFIEGDINGDGIADLQIELLTNVDLGNGDFVL